MGRREDLMAAEERAWTAFNAELQGLGPEQLEAPGLTADGWSLKDLLWHVGCWWAEAGQQLERIRMGTYEEMDWQTDARNAEFLAEGRRVDLATVRLELVSARSRALAEFGRLDELTRAAEDWYQESGELHYRDHAEDVRAHVARLRGVA